MFKTVDSDIMIGTCTYCNSLDSFKFRKDDKWMFLCHDCQRLVPAEKLKKHLPSVSQTESTINFNNILNLCTPVRSLDVTHPFYRYCVSRKIPFNERDVYYTDKFDKISEYAGTPVKDKERLILPFFDEDGKLFGVQGRSIDKNQIRYITLMFDKDKDKIFGLDSIDATKDFFVVEGPIDSFFIKNCVAMAGSDVSLNKYQTNAILCYDNEPRSNEIVSKMKKSLEEGYRIVIWPDSIKQKDANEMVLNGIDVDYTVRSNIYSGLAGQLHLNTWKK